MKTNNVQLCPGAPTVTDVDGNTYNTVLIGNQCWMKENLHTTKYADGTEISLSNTEVSLSTPYHYYPNNDASKVSTYGYLYNWKAVMRSFSSSAANPSGVQGICPNGWHVPSEGEWNQLINYVKSQSAYCCNGVTEDIGKALASTTGWESSSSTCAVGNNLSNNNATGFSALGAGFYQSSAFYNFQRTAFFWSTTMRRYIARTLGMGNQYSYSSIGNRNKDLGLSVRCVRD